ncbi:cofactor-independent phosphoglycerate mutase [Maridesulfovibrio hydrothermalis]|uniref:Putative 2,3-bisphosphoglycerate-independent phosphoglycerate mutase n=1 Tax=Maridesulfovibrio hydrothermalis AM13 = DSM 14728 TaxID=1121451 RepID=L0RDK4_9BACT|nr:cofactor-independent phosphoglycerate mutase [Maridesulfovibrio hydrothermalis]CCO24848.1 putative 2,3-bisphosphoglycerate-independent phosphoglycerate mutase [Maridesulfovibrio hydrothermalis AM13 = DSM 14728]
MKLLFLIADGMGGWPIEELGDKTTLEAANTPNMDMLAGKGLVGTCRTVPKDMAPGSDVANMSLLGFDPRTYHTGRGPIEAAAQGLDLDPDDLVWRMNLVNISSFEENGTMFDYSAGHIGTDKSVPLVEKLQKELGNDEFTFYPGIQYRHLLVHKGGAKKAERELEIRPPHDLTDKPIADDVKEFAKSPLMNKLVRDAEKVLAGNGTKAVSIWPWGQGKPLTMPPFKEKFGMKGAVVSAVDLIKGLGRASGLEVIDVEGATGLVDTNYAGKVEATLKFLEHGDFVYVHLEGPDESGHMGSVEDKIKSIERFDKLVVGPLLEKYPLDKANYVITCDHYTPIETRTHDAAPVPFILTAPKCIASRLESFSEEIADRTGIIIPEGHDFMQWVLDKIK